MKERIKTIFLSNIWLKLLSLVLAVLGWCMIMNLSDPQVTVTIKGITVNKTNEQAVVDENMIYDVVSGDTINVSVTGPRSIVQSLNAKDVNAYVDLKELSITNSCPIHIDFISESVNKSVELVSKSEEVMILSLEQMVTENKQIVVELTGTPENNYYATASVSPLMLEVYGSSTQVDKIEKLVATVDISSQTSSYTTEVKVVPYDTDGNVLDSSKFTMANNHAEVTVDMYPTKNINVVIEASVSAEYGFACQPLEQAPKTITIAGPSAIIGELTEIRIPFSREGLKETLAENIDLSDYIPEQCFLVSDMDTVSVTVPVVMLDENKLMSVSISDITLKNLPSNLQAINSSQKVEISIWGMEGDTASITSRALGLYVDCSSVTKSGSYELPIMYNSNEQIIIDAATVSLIIGGK